MHLPANLCTFGVFIMTYEYMRLETLQMKFSADINVHYMLYIIITSQTNFDNAIHVYLWNVLFSSIIRDGIISSVLC